MACDLQQSVLIVFWIIVFDVLIIALKLMQSDALNWSVY